MSLIVMPFIGECGWQIMRYQAYCRKQSHKYENTHVYCMKGFKYLYEDFADTITEVEVIGGTPDMWMRRGEWKFTDDIKIDLDYCVMDSVSLNNEIINPCKIICEGNIEQEFIKFGKYNDNLKYDIVCHARNDKREVIENRNWGFSKWYNLVGKLSHKKLKICFIGSKDASLSVDSFDDYRGCDLETTCNILASSKLCVGSSSGPMHLSSLCECPVLVWTDNRLWKVGNVKATNRDRYSSIWNPLGVKNHIIDDCDWQPSVDCVYNKVMEIR